jgi:hypothetical protein
VTIHCNALSGMFLWGWAQNVSGTYKKERKSILNTLDLLDKKAENTPLASEELDLRHCLNNRIVQMLREEVIKWYQ